MAIRRMINAARNSARAWNYLIRNEAAFRLEAILLALALPVGWLLAPSWRGYGLLIASLVMLLIVEVLNTGIEAACDAFSREFNTDIRLAKDCGSLAVAMAGMLAGGIWVLALLERVFGLAL